MLNVLSSEGLAMLEGDTLVVGDTHISDRVSSRHIDYFRDCQEFLMQITNSIIEHKIKVLILTGDLVGRTNEKNLASREVLLYFMKVIQQWNDLTGGNVYVVRGNHDISGKMTDFDMFVSLGLLKMAPHIDASGVRFHLVNYGEHTRDLAIEDSLMNVVVGHSEFHVEGKTDWFFRSHEAVNVASLNNFYGVDMIVGGHIHKPSPSVVETSIKDKSIKLFYLGCGTRPAYDRNIWDKCFGLKFSSDDTTTELTQIDYNLRPVSEIFHPTLVEEDVYQDFEEEPQLDSFSIEELQNILGDLNKYNLIGDANYRDQIKSYGRLDEDATNIALAYIDKVEGEFK